MKNINIYINENKSEQYACEIFAIALKSSKINKETIYNMLNNLDIKMIKILSDYFSEIDNFNYIAFEPNSDLFNSENNKDKIISQISEYINKNITMV